MIWNRWIPMAALALLLAVPWLAPRSPELQEDAAGARLMPPLSRASAIKIEDHRVWIVTHLRRSEARWVFTRAGRPGSLPAEAILAPPAPRLYVLGTDSLGRDVLSRVLHGARRSVGIGLASVGLGLIVGLGAGSAAAMLGGWADSLLMRAVDVFMSIPQLILLLAAAAFLEPSNAVIVAVLGLSTWTSLARVSRAKLISLREGDLHLAALSLGASSTWRTVRHLLPQLTPVILVTASLRFADTVLLESALGFLGLGSQPPAVSLGGMIAAGRQVLPEGWWLSACPGALLAILVLGFRAAAGRLRGADPPAMI